jgi:hypothetical protein
MTMRQPPLSLCLFLGCILALGVLVHHLWDAVGVAAFLLVLSTIEAKPAWKWFFDPPGDKGNGRFLSWRRVLPVSPKEQRQFPPTD